MRLDINIPMLAAALQLNDKYNQTTIITTFISLPLKLINITMVIQVISYKYMYG